MGLAMSAELKRPQPLRTIKEVAEIMSCSVKTVRRRIEAKRLRVIRDGRLLRIESADLEDYIRDHRSH